MNRSAALMLTALTLGAGTALGACSADDGADVRGPGSVGFVGEPPAESGSVSASATGCKTQGASTRAPTNTLQVGLDEWTITPEPTSVPAGAIAVVAKNFGTRSHALYLAKTNSPADIKLVDGKVDEGALATLAVLRIEAILRNTICRAVFDLDPGTYVLFDPLVESVDGQTTNNLARGMATTINVS